MRRCYQSPARARVKKRKALRASSIRDATPQAEHGDDVRDWLEGSLGAEAAGLVGQTAGGSVEP